MSLILKKFDSKCNNKIAVASEIMIKGEESAAGSKILQGFYAPFSAAVVESIKQNGYEVGCILNSPEFGIYNEPQSKIRTEDVFDIVRDSKYDFYLSNDYWGFNKFMAAKSGTVYLHPTYGRVSRFGLIQSASSMDQIGILGKDIQKVFEMLEVISGKDDRDSTTFKEKYKISKLKMIKSPFFIRDFSAVMHYDKIAAVFFILASAEISNNISRYDGVKFGYRSQNVKKIEDLYFNTRSEGFESFTKIIATFGTAFLSKDFYTSYYEKSLKLRRSIKDGIEDLLNKHGVLAFALNANTDMRFDYKNALIYKLPALTGLPALSIACGNEYLLLIANEKCENDLLECARELEV